MLPGVQFDQLSINGLISYAQQQSAQFRSMHARFANLTQNVDGFITSKGDGTVNLFPNDVSLQASEDNDQVHPTVHSAPDRESTQYIVAPQGEPDM